MDRRPEHLGHNWQQGGIQRCCIEEGRGKGVSLIRVRNGRGLDFSILPDRGMDVFDVSFQGVQMSWISRNGLSSNREFDPHGFGWLRTFGGGMLTTCGLRNVGPPVEDQGEQFGLHGRISCQAAEHISCKEYWVDGVLHCEVSGEVRESNVFGEDLVLRRSYRVNSASDQIEMDDTILNMGSRREQLMLLYHLNWGSPLLGPESKLYIDFDSLSMREGEKQEESLWGKFSDPVGGIDEKVYFFDLKPDAAGKIAYQLENPLISKGVKVSWNKNELPMLTEWKMMGSGDYVLGLEPSNAPPLGRISSRETGKAEFLEPKASKEVSMLISFYTM